MNFILGALGVAIFIYLVFVFLRVIFNLFEGPDDAEIWQKAAEKVKDDAKKPKSKFFKFFK